MSDIRDKILDKMKCLVFNVPKEVFGYVNRNGDFIIERLEELDEQKSYNILSGDINFHTHSALVGGDFGVFFPSHWDINTATGLGKISYVFTPIGVWKMTRVKQAELFNEMSEELWTVITGIAANDYLEPQPHVFRNLIDICDLGIQIEFQSWRLNSSQKGIVMAMRGNRIINPGMSFKQALLEYPIKTHNRYIPYNNVEFLDREWRLMRRLTGAPSPKTGSPNVHVLNPTKWTVREVLNNHPRLATNTLFRAILTFHLKNTTDTTEQLVKLADELPREERFNIIFNMILNSGRFGADWWGVEISTFATVLQAMITQKTGFKKKAVQNAMASLTEFSRQNPTKTTITYEEVSNLKGFGVGMLKRFKELEATGRVKEVEDVLDRLKTINLFTGIYGVGEVIATKWYEQGYRTLSDINKLKLTPSQQLGVKYYDDLQLKIPREEIDVFNDILQNYVNNYNRIHLTKIRAIVAGSYLRGRPVSSDIDVVVNAPLTFNDFSVIKHTLASGNSKILAIGKIKERMRRIDFELVSDESWAAALLYFTGSKTFNTDLRAVAKKKGFLLNEKGLFDGGRKIATPSERDIFDKLGVEYVEPRDRDI